METSIQLTEDSPSILQFLKPSKSQTLKQKKESKELEQLNRRKNSTQLSLSSWLVKKRSKQDCELANLPKSLVLNIYSYLRISQIVKVSQTCFYFYESSKSIWNDSDFFKEVQTDKLSCGQLKRIFQKGGRMGHVKQLRNIYMGKNLKSCRQKIKVKVQQSSSKPIIGNLLQVFEVGTKIHKGSAFILDSHLQQVINSSFRSLTSIKLQSCRFIRKFYDISKCTQITSLSITENSYLSNDDIRIITKNCFRIENLDLSGCDGLDQGVLKLISKLNNLQTLSMNNYNQPFGDLQCLKPLTSLRNVSLENSCIVDLEGIQMVKQLSALEQFNINGCLLLTDFFLQSVMSFDRDHRILIHMNKTKFGEQILKEWQNFSQQFSTKRV